MAGFLIDYLKTKGFDPNKVTKWTLGILGLLMAIAMYFVSNAESINEAIGFLAFAMFCERWIGCTFWSMPATISQRDDVGIVAGAMNTLGNSWRCYCSYFSGSYCNGYGKLLLGYYIIFSICFRGKRFPAYY